MFLWFPVKTTKKQALPPKKAGRRADRRREANRAAVCGEKKAMVNFYMGMWLFVCVCSCLLFITDFQLFMFFFLLGGRGVKGQDTPISGLHGHKLIHGPALFEKVYSPHLVLRFGESRGS